MTREKDANKYDKGGRMLVCIIVGVVIIVSMKVGGIMLGNFELI